MLWRGCGQGCLDFLEDGEDPGSSDKDTFEAGKGDDDEEFQFSDDE